MKFNMKIKILINIIIFNYFLNYLVHSIRNIPFISIIIPVYNNDKYISSCLNSIINQTINNIEIICIDDGSTDNSIKIIKEYQKKDNRIKLISEKKRGPGISRNIGINKSKGEFLSFMDSDDIYPNNYILEFMYNKCVKNKVLICGGGLRHFSEKNKKIKLYNKMKIFIFEKEGIINYFHYQYDFGFTRFLYNKAFIKKNKIYFPNYFKFEDPPFFVKAMIYAKKFYVFKEITYLYRILHKNKKWNERFILNQLNGLKECLILSYKFHLDKLYCLSLRRLNSQLFLNPIKIFIKNKKLKRDLFIILTKYFNLKKCNINLNKFYIPIKNSKNIYY